MSLRAINEKNLETHFEFGKNWEKLVNQLNDDAVAESTRKMADFTGFSDFKNKTFLDIGCGSGLSSLAAFKLGAKSISSVDIDPQNIKNVEAVKQKFNVPAQYSWSAWVSSIVEAKDVHQLPRADIVYSWGVLHHTGSMWEGIDHCTRLVNPGGYLYLMLYRDAFFASTWKNIKYFYTKAPQIIKWAMRNTFASLLILGAILKGKNPARIIRDYPKKSRGMSWYIDVTDWVGGYPFEYASAEETTRFLESRGFRILKISPKPDGKFNLGYRGTGSYEYLAQKV